VLVFLAMLTGCLQGMPLPFVGDCAVYSDGTYDYGQIGIGSCIAGPEDLQLVSNDGDPVLLVSNSDHLHTFTSGSLLAIPWDQVDLEQGRNLVSDLDPDAMELPDYAAGIALWDENADGQGDLALVASRYSEEGRTRVYPDQVWMADVTDARHPVASNRGPDGQPWVQVQSDPTDVVVDPDSGLAFVANRTSHSVSVMDMTGEVVDIVLPWPEQSSTDAVFDDVDTSGSTGALVGLTADDPTLVPDEDWVMTWSDGSFRVWAPQADGVHRYTGTGGTAYAASGFGAEVDPSAMGLDAISSPSVLNIQDVLYMYFVDQGQVRVATADTDLATWTLQDSIALSTHTGHWDEQVQGSSVFVGLGELVMLSGGTDGLDGTIPAIGRASSTDGATFTRSGSPVLEPTWDHEAGGITDPDVWWDSETQQWRMVYGAWDGSRWTVGHATSLDTVSWESDPDPLFAVDGVDVAAPVVTAEPGIYRMWYARNEGSGWSIGAATSPDGWTWIDQGSVIDLGLPDGDPPGPAVQAAVDRHFRLDRTTSGKEIAQIDSGTTAVLTDVGLSFGVASGYQLGTEAAGAVTAGGLSMGSVDPATGTAWYTVRDAAGTPSIGIGKVTGPGLASVEGLPIMSPTESYEDRGISAPTVVPTSDGYVMLYAAHRRSTTAIARATSTDGRSWTRSGLVLEPGEDWDSIDVVPGSVLVQDDGTWRLFYSGSDGETWYLGEATSSDQGSTWTRQAGSHGYSFATGSPGDWDDSGVRDPFVMADADGTWHMWYAGFDGDAWRIGTATRDGADGTWVRFEDAFTLDKRPVIDLAESLFHPDGALRPVVLSPDQQAALGGNGLDWQVWYAGRMSEVSRVGLALGRAPDHFHRVFKRPTAGDTLRFQTLRGDPDQVAIPLDATVGGSDVTAVGISSLAIDRERGFLYVVGKLRPYIFVIDIRDDSPLPDGSADANYLDIEAVIAARSASGASGFRQVMPLPGQDRLLALNDSPNGVWSIDISDLVDDAYSDILYDKTDGFIAAPRGSAADAGLPTLSGTGGVGVGQMVMAPDGRRLFVSNFNANSIGLYDLALGPYGIFVQEVTNVGENPFALELSPDGQQLIFANYTGEMDRSGDETRSTLGILDIDETSPTYMQVKSWVVNQ